MNIESVNLSSLAPSSAAVESLPPLLADSGVVSEGFSGALVAQIGLLSAIKTGDALPLQTPDLSRLQDSNDSQDVTGLPIVGKIDMQDFAALVGNDLPSSYKTKDDVDHEAALVAVTDTLKYIAIGTTAGEKVAEAKQNMKDVIAMAIPAEQNMKDVIAMAIPAEQNMKDVIAMAIPAEQNMKDVIAMAIPAEQNMKDVIAMAIPAEQNMKDKIAMAIPAEQNMKDVIAMAIPAEQNMKDKIAMAIPAEQNMKDVIAMAIPAEQNIKDVIAMTVLTEKKAADVVAEAEQSMKDVVAMDVPVQMDLKQANDKAEKKQVEGDAQIACVEDNRGTEELVAAITLPAAIPTEQGTAVNNLVSAEGVLLSFIKPSTGDAKPSPSLKAPVDVLHSEVVFRQPVQDKQDFNLKYFENAGQAEKAERGERQIINLEGEKTLPRVGTDIAALNRPVVDNKADVPAITKPLSHPEWNKDLGERIVWMSSKAIPAAEVRLNPQHLGPVSVRVNVADDQATVVFTAQHAATREALEASIPKLREMMSAQQLNLVEVSVSQGSASDQGRSQSQNYAQTADGRGQQGAVGAIVDGVDDVEQEIESGRAVVSKGLLSIYV